MTHPRIATVKPLHTPCETAASLGYAMPAEWTTQERVWVVTPHNHETWPGCFAQAADQFERFVHAVERHVEVARVEQLGVATNDSWIRDFGPIFVTRRSAPAADDAPPPLACHDFGFNGWGGKYEQRDLDDVAPQHLAARLDLPVWIHDFILEGGSIDVNGLGCALTTEQCLLNPNRLAHPASNGNAAHRTREQIERRLRDALGVTRLIWLPGGIAGDDTDGHVDDIARFVAPDRVVAAAAPPHHPDHETTGRNLAALRRARDQNGRKLTVVELPVPEPVLYDFPADRFGPGGQKPVPAGYANFLLTNGAAIVPVFGQPADDLALRTLEQAMPHTRLVPVRAEHLVVGLGAFHCLTQQQPAV